MKAAQRRSASSENASLAETLIGVFDSLNQEGGSRESGPTISDTTYAQMLARVFRDLPGRKGARTDLLEQYLQQNQAIAAWASQKLSTSEGILNLKALLRLELRKE